MLRIESILAVLVIHLCTGYAAHHADRAAFAAPPFLHQGLQLRSQKHMPLLSWRRTALNVVSTASLRVKCSAATIRMAEGVPAVLEKPSVTTAPETTDAPNPDKPYHVLLFNDPMNTREYVCEVLCSVFGHSKSQAYTIMNTAHSTGFAVCNTTDKEEADAQSAQLSQSNLMSSVVQAD